MSQLIVRQLEEAIVKELKRRAGLHGVSVEEEHRRILRQALLRRGKKKQSFKKYLLSIPDAGTGEAFDRVTDLGRHVEI